MGNGLLPNGRRNVGLSSKGFCGIYLMAISHKVVKILFHKMGLKIALLKLQPHISGANELKLSFRTGRTWYTVSIIPVDDVGSIGPCLNIKIFFPGIGMPIIKIICFL